MKNPLSRLNLGGAWLSALLAAVITSPVIAQTPNFGTLKLLPGFSPPQGKISGYTGGSYSLSTITKRDRNRNLCVGFADPNPDYIMVLEKDFSRLQILVNSRDNDTTLVIKGPDDKTIRCGDDTGKSKDASIDDLQWKAGTYHVWVGVFQPGVKYNYTLTVQEK